MLGLCTVVGGLIPGFKREGIMSIAFPLSDTVSSLDQLTPPIQLKPLSAKRLAANRRNALRSTGPRTTEGKRRSSTNALKHGLCANTVLLPGECPAAFATARHELKQEFRPRTPGQNILLNQ